MDFIEAKALGENHAAYSGIIVKGNRKRGRALHRNANDDIRRDVLLMLSQVLGT